MPTHKLSTEEKQKILDDFAAETGATEIDMNAAAEWALANGRWPTQPFDPVKDCARQLSRAAREEMITDAQGRDVRKRHCYVIVEPDGQKRWRWIDIVTAAPEPMHKSLQARRRMALGDVQQLATDLSSYNDNNHYGAQLEMSFNFDEDLAEMEHPTDYPEDPEDD